MINQKLRKSKTGDYLVVVPKHIKPTTPESAWLNVDELSKIDLEIFSLDTSSYGETVGTVRNCCFTDKGLCIPLSWALPL
jgi:hypothetical protein